jgi:hypothetical protein
VIAARDTPTYFTPTNQQRRQMLLDYTSSSSLIHSSAMINSLEGPLTRQRRSQLQQAAELARGSLESFDASPILGPVATSNTTATRSISSSNGNRKRKLNNANNESDLSASHKRHATSMTSGGMNDSNTPIINMAELESKLNKSDPVNEVRRHYFLRSMARASKQAFKPQTVSNTNTAVTSSNTRSSASASKLANSSLATTSSSSSCSSLTTTPSITTVAVNGGSDDVAGTPVSSKLTTTTVSDSDAQTASSLSSTSMLLNELDTHDLIKVSQNDEAQIKNLIAESEMNRMS